MDPKYYGLIELGLTFGIVAIWTIQQLWSLRDRPPRADDPPADKPRGDDWPADS